MLPSRKACEALGVCANTLRKWANEGKIKYVRTPENQRLYDVGSILGPKSGRRRVLYCRVSSRNQRADLASQVRYLKERFPEHEVIEDFGSGLNFKRKGFVSLLESVLSGAVEEVVVSHKDRLCRFGFELVRSLADKHSCRILVLDDSTQSPSQELVQDLISIIHVFSCRLYGLRKYSGKIKKDPDLPKVEGSPETEELSGPEPVLVQSDSRTSEKTRHKSKPVRGQKNSKE